MARKNTNASQKREPGRVTVNVPADVHARLDAYCGDRKKLRGVVSAVLENFLDLPHAAQQAMEGETPHEPELREAYANLLETLAERVRAGKSGGTR
jgi:hypothetical protein